MAALTNKFDFEILPSEPYSFRLTVQNPAGWSLFTPFEVFVEGVLWTAAHLSSELVGIRLSSDGSPDNSHISVRVYTGTPVGKSLREEMIRLIRRKIGADEDIGEFYSFASEDPILKHTVNDLYGMHDTFPTEIFPEAVLAILLQMAPLKRSNEMMASFITQYGETAEFDGKRIMAWPVPEVISGITEKELAERCRVGYRAKSIVRLAKKLVDEPFPSPEELEAMSPEESKKRLLTLPGIGDYSADIVNPHGGFPIDVWSAEVFSMLFFGTKPENNRNAVTLVKEEGIRRWGKWAWMAFFYVVQDLPGLSRKLGITLRFT